MVYKLKNNNNVEKYAKYVSITELCEVWVNTRNL